MDDYAEDLLRGEQLVSVPDSSPSVPPPNAPTPLEIAGPSFTSQQQPEHIPITSRDLLAFMDAIRTYAATFASLAPS